MVLLVLGLFSALFSIRIEGVLSGGDLRLASRRIIGEVSHLRGKAAYTRTDQYLECHIDDNTLRVPTDAAAQEATGVATVGGTWETSSRELKMPKGVVLKDVVVFPHGKFQEGTARIRFYPNGCVDRTLFHLENERDEVYTLEVNPLTGQVMIYDTYIDQRPGE
jgi:hypothetical protein